VNQFTIPNRWANCNQGNHHVDLGSPAAQHAFATQIDLPLLFACRIEVGQVLRTRARTYNPDGSGARTVDDGYNACNDLADRRNVKLHSGHAAYRGIGLEEWAGMVR